MIQKLLLYYFVGINIFAFFLFGYDKLQAKRKGRRVSEHELHIVCVSGGFIGGSLAIYFFHHKSSKKDFLLKHIAITLGWVIYGVYYFFYLNPLNFLR